MWQECAIVWELWREGNNRNLEGSYFVGLEVFFFFCKLAFCGFSLFVCLKFFHFFLDEGSVFHLNNTQMCKNSNSIAQTKAGKSEAAYHWQINFPSYLYLQEITLDYQLK